MKPELLYELLNRALEEEMGLVVSTNNPKQMAAKLHDVTKDSSKYSPLMITVPSTSETVIIAKRSVELDDLGELK